MEEARKHGFWHRILDRLRGRKEYIPVYEGPLAIRAAGETDVGRERDRNEDAFLCLSDCGLFLVADGMGGETAGDEASRLAVETLQEVLTPERLSAADRSLEETLREALEAANEAVLDAARSLVGRARMGTTAALAVVREGVVHISHVGDSRVYLIRDGKAVSLTRDHSTVMALVDAGHLTLEQARTHPLRNELTQCLGVNERVNPDYCALRLRPGDRILLCTDGLWDMVSDEDLARIVTQHPEPHDAVQTLITAANEAGGYDNITAIVIAVEAGEVKEVPAQEERAEPTTDPVFVPEDAAEPEGSITRTAERLRRLREEKPEEQRVGG